MSGFHLEIFIIFGVGDVQLLVTLKSSEKMFWREGIYFLIGQKCCFKGLYEKSFLKYFWFHTLAPLGESTPGFFSHGWVGEENKAGLILIITGKLLRDKEALENMSIILTGLESGGVLFASIIFEPEGIFCIVLLMSGTELTI